MGENPIVTSLNPGDFFEPEEISKYNQRSRLEANGPRLCDGFRGREKEGVNRVNHLDGCDGANPADEPRYHIDRTQTLYSIGPQSSSGPSIRCQSPSHRWQRTPTVRTMYPFFCFLGPFGHRCFDRKRSSSGNI